jgi:hypothetical protein
MRLMRGIALGRSALGTRCFRPREGRTPGARGARLGGTPVPRLVIRRPCAVSRRAASSTYQRNAIPAMVPGYLPPPREPRQSVLRCRGANSLSPAEAAKKAGAPAPFRRATFPFPFIEWRDTGRQSPVMALAAVLNPFRSVSNRLTLRGQLAAMN